MGYSTGAACRLRQLAVFAMVALQLYSCAATNATNGTTTSTTYTMTETTYTATATTATATTTTATTATVTTATATATTITGTDTNTTTTETTTTATTATATDTSTITATHTATMTATDTTTTVTVLIKATISGSLDIKIEADDAAAFIADPDVRKGISQAVAEGAGVPVHWVEVNLMLSSRRLQTLEGETRNWQEAFLSPSPPVEDHSDVAMKRRLAEVTVQVDWTINIPEGSSVKPDTVVESFENYATVHPTLKIGPKVQAAMTAAGKTPTVFSVDTATVSAPAITIGDGTTTTSPSDSEAEAESGMSTGVILCSLFCWSLQLSLAQ